MLIILSACLLSCTFIRQVPLIENSKDFIFKKSVESYASLQFTLGLQNFLYLKESVILSLYRKHFNLFQFGGLIYGYKGLIGRLSPILVHCSLLLILFGASWGAFNSFKTQEFLPSGEIFRIQNPISIGKLTQTPKIDLRVNDFWVEYRNGKVQQFYSYLSILNQVGDEMKTETISVNNPLIYDQIFFYQSDWDVLGFRMSENRNNNNYELPLFPFKKGAKIWVTWITNEENRPFTLVIDQLQIGFTVYDTFGTYLCTVKMEGNLDTSINFLEVISSSGLQIKYDPTLLLVYIGFGLLMITSLLSYVPYTQIWVCSNKTCTWLGSATNRGKIQLEVELQSLVTNLEKKTRNLFVKIRQRVFSSL